MASPLWTRLRALAPKTKKVVTCLIRIATQATAAAFPASALLVNVMGAATEQAAEEALDALQPDQKAQVEALLGQLIESHLALIEHLEPLADQARSVEELSNLVRESLDRMPTWKKQYESFARGLADIDATLRRVEAKVDGLSVQLEAIHLRFDELDRKPKSPYWRFQVAVPGVWLRRPVGASADEKWERVCATPAEIEACPGEEYRWEATQELSDAGLAGLAHLRGLTTLQSLNVRVFREITDAGLAHLRGLTALQFLDLRSCEEVTDAGLAHLRGLTALQLLDLFGCARITDAGLTHLRRLTALSTLSLANCKRITDAGLAHLRGLTALQSLELTWNSQITDAGLAHLRGLTALQLLDLFGCARITDAGLAHLRGLTALSSLNLGNCERITDVGLAHLRGLTALQSLVLGMCDEITDAGLAHLRGLTALQSLDLFGCARITDAGLEHLLGLTALQMLSLSECGQITDAGVVALQEALPNCEIKR